MRCACNSMGDVRKWCNVCTDWHKYAKMHACRFKTCSVPGQCDSDYVNAKCIFILTIVCVCIRRWMTCALRVAKWTYHVCPYFSFHSFHLSARLDSLFSPATLLLIWFYARHYVPYAQLYSNEPTHRVVGSTKNAKAHENKNLIESINLIKYMYSFALWIKKNTNHSVPNANWSNVN